MKQKRGLRDCLQEQVSEELAAACLKTKDISGVELQERKEKTPENCENDPTKYEYQQACVGSIE